MNCLFYKLSPFMHKIKTQNHDTDDSYVFIISFKPAYDKIAVTRVTVLHSIIVSLYTEFFPLEQLLPLRNFQKKSVSQSTQNALKRMEMQKKKNFFYPLCVVFPLAAEFSNFNTINPT